jgi:hypothetical protein
MTANELADNLEVHEFTSDFLFVREVVDILRQFDLAESIIKQQELEIERLKTIIEAYKVRPRGKSEFAGQTHLGVYLGEK